MTVPHNEDLSDQPFVPPELTDKYIIKWDCIFHRNVNCTKNLMLLYTPF